MSGETVLELDGVTKFYGEQPLVPALRGVSFSVRRGELVALDWSDVDLEGRMISVRRSWDPRAGFIETKSDAGRRRVPIASALAEHLKRQRAELERTQRLEAWA